MKAVWMLKNSFLWYAVTMASLALVIGGLIALAGSLRSHRGSRRTVPAGLLAFAAFAVFMILMAVLYAGAICLLYLFGRDY